MRRILLSIIMLSSVPLMAEGAFFDFAMGPDINVKDVANTGTTGTRFRLNLELGGKHLGFVLSPAFGSNVNSIYLGPRAMLPMQIGGKPLYIVPDFSIGPDFDFANGVIGLAMDMKIGVRLFYELQDGMGVSFRPFGMSIRPFNVWFGDTPNQTQISVRYEMMFGFTYFF